MKILIIQTAFLGDVVLATPLIEKLKKYFPEARIDFLLRKGNESLLQNHPHIGEVLVFDKKKNKYRQLFQLIRKIRKTSYDRVINLQRFFSSGLITALSKGKIKTGFDKNPLSFFFDEEIEHIIRKDGSGEHEVQRNLNLIRHFTDNIFIRPKLYPSQDDFQKVKTDKSYLTIAPASIWFTKKYPKKKWIQLIDQLPAEHTIYLLGGKTDVQLCEAIQKETLHNQVIIKAGQLNLLQSAALMKNAIMNYVNDSAPLHLASAMNAPVTAFFCSTVPEFGFGPLSDQSTILQTTQNLTCRPCGLHGKKACPEGHFKCSEIKVPAKLLY